MLENIKNEVRVLLSGNGDGHGFDHIQRVYDLAVKFAREENADETVTALAALLHDADDYKLFGQENADKLFNARKIMQKNGVHEETASRVCDIIANMGYSKALKGIRPNTLEGQIVSDADMLDAVGAMGLVRNLAYALERCHGCADNIFDKGTYPGLNLTSEQYKTPNRKSDNFINHFFEKLLKLQGMMFTGAAKKEAARRHEFMVVFLREFFVENDCPEWLAYLADYEKQNKNDTLKKSA